MTQATTDEGNDWVGKPEPAEVGPDDVVTAAAPPAAPPIDWFRDPQMDGPTPLTVDDDGRVRGHLALWDTGHIGLPGDVKPPKSHADYAYFHTGSREVSDQDGARLIATGHVTLDTGHAGMEADARSAAAHYDNTGSLAADVCAGEDAHGIWVAGATAPGLDDLRLHKLRACGLSGDWRRIGPGLELVAALSVPTPGFPIPRSRVASAGEPLALVAAGAMAPPPVLDKDEIAAAVVAHLDQRDADRIEREALTAALGEDDRLERAAIAAELGEDDREERALLVASLTGDPDDHWLVADALPSTMPPQLQESYIHGKVAKRINWGVPGDFNRCVAQAKIHGMGHMAKGACATLHKKALGVWPGREGGSKGKALAASAQPDDELGSIESDRFVW